MTTITARGPVFDGRAHRTSNVMLEEIVAAAGQEALHETQAALDAVLKNPTGYYESRITVDLARDEAVVHDQGVIYGPWLAGVSSLNARSRFKGYAHWRRATQRTQANVGKIAAPIVRTRVAEMNR